MPEGVAYPFDPLVTIDVSASSAAWTKPPARTALEPQPTRGDSAELRLLIETLEALDHGLPAVAARFREQRADPGNFPVRLDAPFGIDGPALFELGDLRALFFKPAMIHSVMRISDPTAQLLDYTRVMMGFLLLHPAPRRIEILGLGGGSLAKYCHRYLPDAEIVAVEIDPRVVALRDRFGLPRDDDRFRVICADAAEHVCAAGPCPDVILLDGFGAAGDSHRLAGLDFYRRCRDRLTERGILVANLCDHFLARQTAKSRLRRVFAGKAGVVPIDRQQNRIIFASNDPAFAPDADLLLRTAARLAARHAIDFIALAQRLARSLTPERGT